MILGVPKPAMLLGLAGLIPFIYGAIVSVNPALRVLSLSGPETLATYGPVIFAFMSGVLWGFAAKAGRATWIWLGLSVAPAIVIFLIMAFRPGDVVASLLIGFPALLAVDMAFWRAGLATQWWMTLRSILTLIVTLCLYASLTA